MIVGLLDWIKDGWKVFKMMLEKDAKKPRRKRKSKK